MKGSCMPGTLKFGLFSLNIGAYSSPATATRLARTAEAAGFDSLWVGEHVVLPDPRIPPSPMAPEESILDPIVTLSFLAAHTTRVLLGTGIIILPQRNPLVLAKELASLDQLSEGRLLFGVGVGYLEPEFRALGVPFEDRGARTEEYLAAMRAIWSQPKPSYHGKYVSFANVQAHPQRNIRIVMGGRSPSAYRRAAQDSVGWYGYALDLEGTTRALEGLREAEQRYQRPAELGRLEISVTPRGTINREQAEQYAALGVHRLILNPPPHASPSELESYIESVGTTLIGQV
jgi:probable F420-dependent oxidoreductase